MLYLFKGGIPMNRQEYLREYGKQWRKKNKDYLNQQAREYYHKLDSKVKEKSVLKNRLRRHKLRAEAIRRYGGKCVCCGETEPLFLCIDHTNGGGNKHRKIMKDKSIGDWLKRNNYPKGFQVLCHNCNMAKGIYGKCPHNK